MIMEKSFNSYINFVCPHCFNTLDECTCEYFPPHQLIFIDRGIQEHIRILNQKGYCTTGCCESHYGGNCISLYVTFCMDYGFNKNIAIPEGFKYLKKKNGICYDISKKLSKEEAEKLKADKLEVLLEWCKSLPVSTIKMYSY